MAVEHADFALDHVQRAGVLGHIVELQSLQQTARFPRREGLVERDGRTGRQIVEDDPNPLSFGVVNFGQVAHAGG